MRLSLKPGSIVSLLDHPCGAVELVTVTVAGPFTVSYRDANGTARSLKRVLFLKRAYRAVGKKPPASALRTHIRIASQPTGGQPGFRQR